jgi:hypothetical protein
MPRKTRADRLTIDGLSEADQQWLASESERLGIDPPNLIRSLIRRRVTLFIASSDDIAPKAYVEAHRRPDAELASETDYRQSLAVDERLYQQPHPDVDGVPPDDASLDELMAAQPSLTERPVEPRRSPWRGPTPQRRVSPSRPAAAVAAPPRVLGAVSAFTLVQPLGLSDNVQRSNAMYDGRNNVMRDNNRWLGFTGTRRA